MATLISEGHTNKSAASALGVSINTVGTHLRAVFAKLGVQSRVQLANCLAAHERATNARRRPLIEKERAWCFALAPMATRWLACALLSRADRATGPQQASSGEHGN